MSEDARESILERYDTTPRDARNLKRLLWTLAVWAVLFAGGSQLLKRELLPAGPISWTVAVVGSGAGVFVLLAYARFVREADELQRTIQLRALALGFGGTFFGIAAYLLFERIGAPRADLGDVAMVMAFLLTAGVLLGQRRYR